MSLKNKKILITAGPTWVPIDSVRVISNISTGRTGMLLAEEAAARGASVTLLLGPCSQTNSDAKIRIVRFSFFDELKNALKRELKNNRYDVVIHSAAVSDFKPEHRLEGKLNSGRTFDLRLMPLEKLVVLIRRMARRAELVVFKLESAVSNKTLIKRAREAGQGFAADLVVANRLNPYHAFIINSNGSQISAKSKQELAKKLIKVLTKD